MHHIYRQIVSLKSFARLVVTQKLENDFPFQPIIKLPKSPWRWWARFQERSISGYPWQISQSETLQLLQLLNIYRASILHIFFGSVAIHFLPVLRLCPIPIVISFHGADVAGRMLSSHYRDTLLELFEKAALLTCRSSNLAGKLKSLGCPSAKICLQRTVLPELPFIQHEPPQDGRWKILQASRLIPKKGLQTTLQAFMLFVKEYPAATLTIAGDGPMKQELEVLSQQLKIAVHVQFIGFQTQEALQQLLAEHSIFLHPSESVAGDTEGIPNALLEALASGIPCIATRHGGIPEAMKDKIDGILVEERQPQQLALAMKMLAQNTELYQQLSSRGAENVRKNFGIQNTENGDCYRFLLQKKSSAEQKIT